MYCIRIDYSTLYVVNKHKISYRSRNIDFTNNNKLVCGGWFRKALVLTVHCAGHIDEIEYPVTGSFQFWDGMYFVAQGQQLAEFSVAPLSFGICQKEGKERKNMMVIMIIIIILIKK